MHDEHPSPDDLVFEPRDLRVHSVERYQNSTFAQVKKIDLFQYLQKLHLKGKRNDRHKSR